MIQRENNGTSMCNSLLTGSPLSVCAFWCIIFIQFFSKFYSLTILCSCCTSSLLYSFHVSLFPMLVFSCCTILMLNFFVLHPFSVGLSSWCTVSMMPFYCLAHFLFYFFHFSCFLCVARFPCFTFLSCFSSCCFLFILHFFRIALFSYFAVSTLPFSHVALFLCCIIFILLLCSCYSFPVLHYFHVALFSVLHYFHTVFFVLHSFHIALSSCFTLLILHCHEWTFLRAEFLFHMLRES